MPVRPSDDDLASTNVQVFNLFIVFYWAHTPLSRAQSYKRLCKPCRTSSILPCRFPLV
jgi:hypothetical protein